MEGTGGGGDAAGGAGAGFEWDADSQLYYHASTGFYHDSVAGWYYSSRDGQYYIYENGNYMPLMTDQGNEPTANYPYDEANQDVLESSCLEPAMADDENETLGPPSEWMEETLINLYLSGYSNREVNAESSLGNTHTNEEEKWMAQYGQVERVNDDLPLLPSIDIWDWHVVQDRVSNGQPVARLVGCLSRGSSKLHPSLPARGGRLRTASEQKTKAYRDRAAERRNLHRGLGIGPGQKQSNMSFDEYEESIDDIDSMGTASVDINFHSSGLHSAKRIMENMGWKEACVFYSVCLLFMLLSDLLKVFAF
ncbi:hypothetical protein BAE44_0019056 [Dichanthelium oligosanthes]|uniref:OCRE domain-containing protein n=1 Tax=Dichanthelium oligosanthes TaxID=888268 RepID=A0A1E5V4D1_9POAL|nr:hypothetical protein BAE44_0019056 [Dichanthelium oligosanthes]